MVIVSRCYGLQLAIELQEVLSKTANNRATKFGMGNDYALLYRFMPELELRVYRGIQSIH